MSDYLVRAMAGNAQIRAFAALSTETVEEARKRHGLSPVATAALGRLLTAGVMMGSMMKNPEDVLTLQIKCGGDIGGLCVTADSQGHVKGYVNNPTVMLPPKNGKLDVGGALGPGFIQVIKDMGLKEPYSGQTILTTGEIGDDLTYYFANSEQINSSVGLGVLLSKENHVQIAGGFIIQLMPFVAEETLVLLEENIRNISSVTEMLSENPTPEGLLKQVLKGLAVEITDTLSIGFHCNCSIEKIEKAIISVGRKEIEEMIAAGETVEVLCHFCNTAYHFTVEELEEILKKAQ